MKNAILFIFILFATSVSSQNTIGNKPSILVYGIAPYTLEPTAYKVSVTLSVMDAQYSGSVYTSVNEMKDEFLRKLSEKGVNTTKITENEIDFIAPGRNGSGTSLIFITTDKEEFKKFLTITIPGYYLGNIQFKVKIKNKTSADVYKEALADAKENAELLAQQMNKKIGTILRVDSPSLPKEYQWSFFGQEEQLRIQVTYELVGN